MDRIEQFNETIKNEMKIILATASENSVTMRTVSPVFYHGAILIFTSADSKKYRQLQRNPHCSIASGPFFAEATANFCGSTMRPENSVLRKIP